VNKYARGSHSREPLRQADQLRVDNKLRKIATEKRDSKILTITSRDVVAAEAHYHHSCYKNYTRPVNEKINNPTPELSGVGKAREQLFQYIRLEIFSDPTVVSLVLLQEKLLSFMNSSGVPAPDIKKA